MSEQEERERVVAIARTWLGTPFHHQGQVKGVGVDCIMLVARCFYEADLIQPFVMREYPFQWAQTRGGELLLDSLRLHGTEIEGPPQPADVAVWRFGRRYSHCAIVVEWPIIIHAYTGRTCLLEDVSTADWLSKKPGPPGDRDRDREVKFFDFWRRPSWP